jgi:ribosomal protein S6
MADTTPTENTSETLEMEGRTLYEIGFHLVPTIVEEDVAAKVGDLRSEIEEAGGIVTGEGFPALISLAYAIKKGKDLFDRAYFGWIKFELAPSAIATIKDAATTNSSILRFLIIKTSPEEEGEHKKPLMQIGREDAPVGEEAKDGAKEVVSEEELDKSLEEIIA